MDIAIDKRFIGVENRLSLLEEGFSRLEGRFSNMEGLMETLFVLVKDGFERMEEKMATKDDIHRLESRIEEMDAHLTRVSNTVDTHTDKIILINRKIGLY